MGYIINGIYNDIHIAAEIGDGTLIWEWCRIGKSIIGKNCKIHNWVHIGNHCVIGNNCNIQEHVYMADGTILGNDVFIAGGVHLTDEKYPSVNIQKKKPVRIGDNTVFGNHAIIIGGLRIGNNSVIGAGAVVTKDIPPNQVWIGNPAKHYCSRDEYDRKQREEPD